MVSLKSWLPLGGEDFDNHVMDHFIKGYRHRCYQESPSPWQAQARSREGRACPVQSPVRQTGMGGMGGNIRPPGRAIQVGEIQDTL
jgi:hypothetical protein